MTLQTSSSISPSSPVIVHRSPWHSPVPYLFGGLAAMLSLIAFALLILACSYSKHAGGRQDSADGERDLESGAGDEDLKSDDRRKEVVFEEKFLVIMAGEENPTFLATPASSRVSSFGSCSCRSNSSEKSPALEVTVEDEDDDDDDDEKQGSGDQVRVRSMGNVETADQ